MTTSSFHIRMTLRPGDIGTIIRLHGVTYSREYGFDSRFEAYVAGPLSKFVECPHSRQRIWIAEVESHIIGCIAIVQVDQQTAQLRWFLVDPAYRRRGLGHRLMTEAINFSRAQQFQTVVLWTVSELESAARLYQQFGFQKTETTPVHLWGVDVIQEKYELQLQDQE
jgi:N-acetylglutamate synthase-like GNAT family acetyltransferase